MRYGIRHILYLTTATAIVAGGHRYATALREIDETGFTPWVAFCALLLVWGGYMWGRGN